MPSGTPTRPDRGTNASTTASMTRLATASPTKIHVKSYAATSPPTGGPSTVPALLTALISALAWRRWSLRSAPVINANDTGRPIPPSAPISPRSTGSRPSG